jgi:hypothetical protein
MVDGFGCFDLDQSAERDPVFELSHYVGCTMTTWTIKTETDDLQSVRWQQCIRRPLNGPVADYYPLVSRAVAALEPNTFERRCALYNRACTAQASQLGKLDPPADNSVIAREREALEKAIYIIEAVAIATEDAENDFEIVSAFATFCKHSTTPECFYDASVLPYPKHAIVAALERQIVLEPTDIRAEWLRTGPMFLWHFLDGVGSVPVALINSNLKQLRQDNATPEQFREEAKRISASYEQSEPFEAIARQEADRVEQRINDALQIRRERLAIDKDFDRERLRLNAAALK